MAQTRGVVPALYDNVDKTVSALLGKNVKELQKLIDLKNKGLADAQAAAKAAVNQIPYSGISKVHI